MATVRFMHKTSFAMVILALIAANIAHAGLISQDTELKMGRDGAKQIESQYRVSTDQAAINLVTQIGQKIAAVSSRPNLPWHFAVLETKEINAVSVPGYVYVNRGLLDFVGSDRDALAGVIAHEVGHTAAHHAARSAEKQLKYSIALQLFVKGNIAQQLGGIATNLALLGYGRKEEFEADKLGTDYMTAAGYNPNGLVRFFEKLETKEAKDKGGLEAYFRSHPPTSDRITRVQQEIAAIGYQGPTSPAPQKQK